MGITLMKMNPILSTATDRETIVRYREQYKKAGKDFPESLEKLAKITKDRAAQAEAFLKNTALPALSRRARRRSSSA